MDKLYLDNIDVLFAICFVAEKNLRERYRSSFAISNLDALHSALCRLTDKYINGQIVDSLISDELAKDLGNFEP